MENLKSLLEDYIRLAWPPFVAGAVLGLILGLLL
jgi:hypothetical protein